MTFWLRILNWKLIVREWHKHWLRCKVISIGSMIILQIALWSKRQRFNQECQTMDNPISQSSNQFMIKLQKLTTLCKRRFTNWDSNFIFLRKSRLLTNNWNLVTTVKAYSTLKMKETGFLSKFLLSRMKHKLWERTMKSWKKIIPKIKFKNNRLQCSPMKTLDWKLNWRFLKANFITKISM